MSTQPTTTEAVVLDPPAVRPGIWPPTWLRPGNNVIHVFIERHQQLWEGVFGVLALAYLVVAISGEELSVSVADELILAFAIFFMAEFLLRLWNSSDRRRYVKRHWIDALTAVPLLGPLRALWPLRLLRLVALVRVLALADYREPPRGRLSIRFFGPLMIFIWLGASYGFWVLERGANPHVNSFLDAGYMALISTLTLGAGDPHPTTHWGQLLGGALIFVALGLITFLSTQFKDWVLQQESTEDVVRHEVQTLRAEIVLLREMVIVEAATSEPPGSGPTIG
jgi:voltage-gated potassium channel